MAGGGQGPGGTSQGTALEVVSLDARPELTLPALELLAVGWPEFMQHDPVAERHQARLATELGRFQILLLDEKDELAALGVAIPFAWDGTVAGLPAGWDAVVTQGVADLDGGRRPTALSALSVTVAPASRGQGLSRLVIQALKDAAARAGLGTLLAPVRPSGKSAYPLTPMGRYLRWARADGTPFDPWLRTHWRLGGEVLGVCPASMEIAAEVAAWEAWTGLAFPESGHLARWAGWFGPHAVAWLGGRGVRAPCGCPARWPGITWAPCRDRARLPGEAPGAWCRLAAP